MKEFLGIDVPSDTDGVLQDVHWSGGGIGYFPTYALGNVISLQIWAKVREALPDLDSQMAAGELLPLSDWLRANLYAWGNKLTPKETLARLTGSDAIDPAAVPRLPRRQAGRAAGLEPARRARARRNSRGLRRPRARRAAPARARPGGDAGDGARRQARDRLRRGDANAARAARRSLRSRDADRARDRRTRAMAEDDRRG